MLALPSLPRPLAAPAAVAAIAAALVGCGGTNDAAAIRATMARLQHATAAKDYHALCKDVLAPSVTRAATAVGLGCEAALARGLGSVQAPTLTVRSIAVHGDRALVGVHTGAANQGSSDDTVEMQKVSGRWLVTRLTG